MTRRCPAPERHQQHQADADEAERERALGLVSAEDLREAAVVPELGEQRLRTGEEELEQEGPDDGSEGVAAPPRMSTAYAENVTCGWYEFAPTLELPRVSMIPPNAAITPPSTSDCILYEKAFLPRLRTTSSSSRIDLRMRPQGLHEQDHEQGEQQRPTGPST